MYCEDLDMIVVLSFKSHDSLADESLKTTVVGFYDNWDGTKLRCYELDGAPTEEVKKKRFGYEKDTVKWHLDKGITGVQMPPLFRTNYKTCIL